MSQFSLFGAAAAEPSLDDLDGVLLAGGHWVRQGGTARLSIVVADVWRADALAGEFQARAVDGPDSIVPAEGGWSVRTAFTTVLAAGAERWSRGANEGPPAGLALTAGGLRLWTVATGAGDDVGYLLGTERVDSALHLAAGAQLSRLGLAAVSIGARGRPGWRITSAKRLRRFAELVGPAPDLGARDWPS
jgi:hypothetical protein